MPLRALRRLWRSHQTEVSADESPAEKVTCDLTGQPLTVQAGYGWTLAARNPDIDERYNFASLADLLIALSQHATIFGSESDDRLAMVAERKLLRYNEPRICDGCGTVTDANGERWQRFYRDDPEREGYKLALDYCPECAANEFDA